MKGNTGMIKNMVKEHKLTLMEVVMKGNTGMIKDMVKVH